MTQQEKLELMTRAAKRAGLLPDGWHSDGGLAVWSGHKWVNWDPLEHDHTAMWLAGHINLPVFHIPHGPGLTDSSGPGPWAIGDRIPGWLRTKIVQHAATQFTQLSHTEPEDRPKPA